MTAGVYDATLTLTDEEDDPEEECLDVWGLFETTAQLPPDAN